MLTTNYQLLLFHNIGIILSSFSFSKAHNLNAHTDMHAFQWLHCISSLQPQHKIMGHGDDVRELLD